VSATYDVAVVGAGIVGLAVAREVLSRRPDARVTVLEQEQTVGAHQSSHNSGVIHAGVYYAPGSLKAQLCVEGAARLYEYCERGGIDARRIGKLIIATEPRELPALDELERRARANGVPGVRRLAAAEIRELEPRATGIAALHSPATGIVDFRAVCERLAGEVGAANGELRLGWRVSGLTENGRGVSVRGPAGDAVEASGVVVCAGLWADRLAARAGASRNPRIVPFRGGYLKLRPERRDLVRTLIYPVPDPALPFLGIHLTPTVDGEVLVGPSALMAGARDAYRLRRVRPRDLVETLTWPGSWLMMARWWRTGLHEVHMAASRRAFAARASRYVPDLRPEDLVPAFAGVRAQTVARDGRLLDDFVLSSTARAIHVRNAPSPAATSSLALASRIVDQLERQLA
jgi:(S)-2-hydroxyglutarate dehydrogenase